MEDHMNACRLAVTAAFGRQMLNFPVDPPRPPINNEIVVYHAQPLANCDALGEAVSPHFFVDVSSVVDEKTAMLAHHKSQKEWLDRSQGMDSYLHTMQDMMAETGATSGRFAFAEGWRRHSHIGFCAREADPIREVLNSDIVA